MTVFARRLLELVEHELNEVSDSRVVAHIRRLLVQPRVVLREWDYGAADEAYPCWSVLEHPNSNTGIAYCENGFGPKTPWGLVFLTGTERMSIGMDSGWFRRFLDAYFESKASSELPIWRVYKQSDGDFPGTPITPEGDWESTWRAVMQMRDQEPHNRFHCEQSVYRSEA